MTRAGPSLRTVLRFGVSGGLSALTLMATLYVLTEYAGLWYVLSATLAWVASFGVNFVLQRQWTFGQGAWTGAGPQLAAFVALFLANTAINAGLLYLLVDHLHAPYLAAQIGLMALIAIWNFFIMRHLIFRRG